MVVSGDNLEAKNVANNESYTVNIVKKGSESAIENIGDENDNFKFINGEIICSNDTKSIIIYTADGREVKKGEGSRLSAKELQQGLYIVITNDSNKTKAYKISVE